ncbi:MAG: hypothetical protein HQM08_26985 [Candidatus Riflebacteria bacterium]|nr:hypothetical protein [Candidatus Riflebacteria bacterium]
MSPEEALNALRKLIRMKLVVDLNELYSALGTRSRMTVFRRLKMAGYRTSFTHAGRFYTLLDIPAFDEQGLWFHRDAGFSLAGNLKESVALLVERSTNGRTHAELQHLLRIRVHNTLLDLVHEKRIVREHFGKICLYVSSDAICAAAQITQRRELAEMMAEVFRVLTKEETLEILVEALRAAPRIPSISDVAERISARGFRVEPRLIQQVFEKHGLIPGKKNRPFASFSNKDSKPRG